MVPSSPLLVGPSGVHVLGCLPNGLDDCQHMTQAQAGPVSHARGRLRYHRGAEGDGAGVSGGRGGIGGVDGSSQHILRCAGQGLAVPPGEPSAPICC